MDGTEPSSLSDAELARRILESSNSEELTGRLPCSECGSSVELDMEAVFRYVLREKYGLTEEELENQLEV